MAGRREANASRVWTPEMRAKASESAKRRVSTPEGAERLQEAQEKGRESAAASGVVVELAKALPRGGESQRAAARKTGFGNKGRVMPESLNEQRRDDWRKGKFRARGPKGPCEICGGDQTTNRSLAQDHCHRTGRLRGKLCNRCNLGIGSFMDDPARLRAAAEYPEKYAEPVVASAGSEGADLTAQPIAARTGR